MVAEKIGTDKNIIKNKTANKLKYLLLIYNI
jgi:hypothetical protein